MSVAASNVLVIPSFIPSCAACCIRRCHVPSWNERRCRESDVRLILHPRDPHSPPVRSCPLSPYHPIHHSILLDDGSLASTPGRLNSACIVANAGPRLKRPCANLQGLLRKGTHTRRERCHRRKTSPSHFSFHAACLVLRASCWRLTHHLDRLV